MRLNENLMAHALAGYVCIHNHLIEAMNSIRVEIHHDVLPCNQEK